MYGIKQVYLNGRFLAPEQAQVSCFDRGFVFGDGVYEVIPAFGGRLFRLEHHLERLDASLRAIRLPNPLTHAEWDAAFTRLIAAQSEAESANGASLHRGPRLDPIGDQSIYLQVTRGVAPRDHAFPPDTVPTVFAYAQPIKYASAEQLAGGVSVVTRPDIRWQRCDIKAIALLANALLRQEALDAGAVEAILVRDGFVTEGAASNIFIVKQDMLVTPPKGPYILPGITRDLILELARAHGIGFLEYPIHEDELLRADEVWLTSSTREILPITRIDGKTVGDGKPGPMHARVFALYREYKQAFCAGAVN
jgi:D-alanine transaminase